MSYHTEHKNLSELYQKLPQDFDLYVKHIVQRATQIEGLLTEKESIFLSLLGAFRTTSGEVLEIGSFKGKSTVILAKSVQLTGGKKIFAVDPLSLPSATDPNVNDTSRVVEDFKQNLKEHNVEHHVDFYQMVSKDLGAQWNQQLRLLWIDGDHTYEGAKIDFRTFAPFLNGGGIVALHDVLHMHEGPIRVFMEDILLSPRFGPCGIWGSIGWAQYLPNFPKIQQFFNEKRTLYKKLNRLIPYVSLDQQNKGLHRFLYKLQRSRVPHRPITITQWCEKILT
ncbi:MAG: class I SAM-dependent methyltransferase, partial [Thermodesulfobacteriota bacterium]|nr:class I SAM-dependent methyltransferase [Thermodesulfobacteriota bacterium]